MIVYFGSYLYDIFGHMFLKVDPRESNFDSIARRVSRTATLDGFSVIFDSGSTASDATFEIVVPRLTADQFENLKHIIESHSKIVVCTANGAFLGTVETFSHSQRLKVFFLVEKKLSE